jgi:hypothetical protein
VRLKLAADVAEAAYDRAADPVNGLAPDARLDMDGFRNVLALRAEMQGAWGGKAPSPDRYTDLHAISVRSQQRPRADGAAGGQDVTASSLVVAIPSRAKLSNVALTEPPTSMPRQASSTTTTPKPSRVASSAE